MEISLFCVQELQGNPGYVFPFCYCDKIPPTKSNLRGKKGFILAYSTREEGMHQASQAGGQSLIPASEGRDRSQAG